MENIQHSSADEAATSKKRIKSGFHGFLFWVAGWFLLQPFIFIYDTLNFLAEIPQLNHYELDGYAVRHYIFFHLCYNILYLVFSLFLARNFFAKKKRAITGCYCLLIIGVVAVICEPLIDYLSLFQNTSWKKFKGFVVEEEYLSVWWLLFVGWQILRNSFLALYLHKSKRVKITFVNQSSLQKQLQHPVREDLLQFRVQSPFCFPVAENVKGGIFFWGDGHVDFVA